MPDPDAASTETLRINPPRFVVLTGDGKGKTTAAVGMAVRAAGHGLRTAMLQFVKGDAWPYGEQQLPRLIDIDWRILGDGCIGGYTERDGSAGPNVDGWQQAREVLGSGDYDLVILDELSFLVGFGWVDVAEIVAGLESRHTRTSVVVTGRRMPDEVIALADTVTVMDEVRHAYRAGLIAQRGIEF